MQELLHLDTLKGRNGAAANNRRHGAGQQVRRVLARPVQASVPEASRLRLPRLRRAVLPGLDPAQQRELRLLLYLRQLGALRATLVCVCSAAGVDAGPNTHLLSYDLWQVQWRGAHACG